MISLEDYRRDPCARLSVPYWKAKTLCVPAGIRIVHDRDFSSAFLERYEDRQYFRLYHDLCRICADVPSGLEMETAREEDLDRIVSIINRSYPDLRVSAAQIAGYRRAPTFQRELWLLARDKDTGAQVACGIADYDPEAGEVSLEWIQVLPEFRRRGIGQAVVNELLRRAQPYAEFSTVSGARENPACPERLYRRCGFTGNDIWHVLREKMTEP